MAPKLSSEQLDRAAGALVGLAVGDALGAPYEFGSGTRDPRMIGGGAFGWEPGEWTDDTQMAICIAEVAASGELDPMAVGQRFLDWCRGGPKDVGSQTRAVLSSAKAPEDLAGLAARHFELHPNGAAGNGSLMRTAAVALAHLGDDEAIASSATAISNLTHGDPLAAEACVLWCIAIDRAVRLGEAFGIRDGLDLLAPASRDRWSRWIDEASSIEAVDGGALRRNGFVVTALQAAHWACIGPEMSDEDRMECVFAQHALKRVISLGGDTDTTAAIAGSLLGARFGVSAFPLEWISTLHGWPGYDARDLVRLALMATGAIRVNDWPDIDSMVEVYRPGGLGPKAVRLNGDDDVWVGGFAALEDAADFDAVVSLCRVGREDVPGEGIQVSPWLIDQEGKNPNLEFIFSDIARQICTWRDEGKRVLLHCVKAERRTPAVAAAYLAERFSLSGDQGWRLAQAVLPGARRNQDFADALDRLWG